jgi:uncharacterized membrane protein YidH (DUF202 family)
VSGLLALVLVFAAPPAAAQCTDEPCADRAKSCEVERAYWHFECAHFSIAAEAFTDLYTRDPRAEFLFNAANARRLSGDCWTALALYQRFLALGPPPDWVDLAKHNVERCQEQIADARKEADRVGPPPPRVPKDAPSQPAPRREPQRQWARDPAGGALVGVGSVLTGVGIGLVAGGAWQRARASDETTDADFGARHRSGIALTSAGIPVLGVGAALVIAGVVRWAVLARAQRRAATRLSGPARR